MSQFMKEYLSVIFSKFRALYLSRSLDIWLQFREKYQSS